MKRKTGFNAGNILKDHSTKVVDLLDWRVL